MKLYNSEYLDKSVDPTFPAKLESYELLDLDETEKVLDLGCGTGFDAINMAKKKAGKGVVYGVDISQEFIDIANASKTKEVVTNVEFLVGSADKLPFEDNALDAVRLERVFQHLHNVEDVWREIKRVLKPNGVLVIVETDWKGLSFFTPEYVIEKKMNDFLVHHGLNNGDASRVLVTDLCRHEFKNTQFEIIPIQIPNYMLANMFIKIEDIAKAAIKAGVLTQAEFEKWRDSVLAVEKCTTTVGLLNMFVIKSNL